MSEVSSPLSRGFNQQGILLTDDSGMIHFKRKQCTLKLSEAKLSVISIKTNESVLELDLLAIIGSQYAQSSKTSSFDVRVFAYEVHNGCCSNPKKDGNARRRIVCELVFHSDEALCCKWVNAINSISQDGGALSWAEDGASIAAPPERKFLCFVNPVGGKREGLKIWSKTVRPMLEEAGIRIQLVVTEYADHAKAVVADMDLSVFNAILTVGGDGLLYEVMNGVASREDGEALLQSLTVMPIPGGTGNGLIKSILHECHEYFSVMNATFVAIKGVRHPMDLCRVRTSDGKISYAFLILAWGLISDVDILSETMRCLGEPRLYIAAVYFIMRKRRYAGRLRMKLVDRATGGSAAGKGCSSSNVGGKPRERIAAVTGDSEESSSADGTVVFHHKSADTESTAVGSEPAVVANMSNPVHSVTASTDATAAADLVPATNLHKVKHSRVNLFEDASSGAADVDGWVTFEEEFVFVWVVQTTHASATMYSGPGTAINDGVFTIFVARDMSRFELLELLVGLDGGEHVNHPKVETYKCTEYSLEPLTDQGIFSLDGEVVPYGLLQAVVMPSAANVLKLRS